MDEIVLPKTDKQVTNDRQRRHRVFIVGAGVSASCGIPVAKEIFRAAMRQLAKKDRSQTDFVHKLLRYLYPSFEETLQNYPNIEDFLNFVEMAKKFNTEDFIVSSLWSDPKLQKVTDITLRAVIDHIWSLM